ncbi:MAG TPA: DNA gyrase modulator, partial [Acidimicrobiales bacterium]|nr:DNA gyrase modulator [Acidimicrobiales bacterium]
MFDIAEAAVEGALAAGAAYADARAMIQASEGLGARNGVLERMSQNESAGVGVRALIGSSWGFFATPDPSIEAARKAGEEA